MIRDQNGLQAEEIGFVEQYLSELINDQVAPIWLNLLLVGSKSHKRVDFGLCSGLDFSIRAQPISKRFTVLYIMVQVSASFAVL